MAKARHIKEVKRKALRHLKRKLTTAKLSCSKTICIGNQGTFRHRQFDHCSVLVRTGRCTTAWGAFSGAVVPQRQSFYRPSDTSGEKPASPSPDRIDPRTVSPKLLA